MKKFEYLTHAKRWGTIPRSIIKRSRKIRNCRQLARLNVDVIEAGFAVASSGDALAVKSIAQEVKGPIISSLARSKEKDIDIAWESVRFSERPAIHTFLQLPISTSNISFE